MINIINLHVHVQKVAYKSMFDSFVVPLVPYNVLSYNLQCNVPRAIVGRRNRNTILLPLLSSFSALI